MSLGLVRSLREHQVFSYITDLKLTALQDGNGNGRLVSLALYLFTALAICSKGLFDWFAGVAGSRIECFFSRSED